MKHIHWTSKTEGDYYFVLKSKEYIVEGYDERFVPEPIRVSSKKERYGMLIMGIEYRGRITDEILETLDSLITECEERRRNWNEER